jgi:hypothetical protein
MATQDSTTQLRTAEIGRRDRHPATKAEARYVVTQAKNIPLRTTEQGKSAKHPATVHFSEEKGSYVVIHAPKGTNFDMNEITRYFLEKVKKEIPSARWWKTRIRHESILHPNGDAFSQITLTLGRTAKSPDKMTYPGAKEFLQEAYAGVCKLISRDRPVLTPCELR